MPDDIYTPASGPAKKRPGPGPQAGYLTRKDKAGLRTPGKQALSGQLAIRWGKERLARMEELSMRMSTRRTPFVVVHLADVAKAAVDEYMDKMESILDAEDAEKAAARAPCHVAKVGELRYCVECGTRWDGQGEAPTCPSNGRKVA